MKQNINTDNKLLKEQNKFPRSLYNKDKWRNTLKAIKFSAKDKKIKILDIGCGASQLKDLLPKSFVLYGVDIEQANLKDLSKTRYKIADVNKKIPFDNNMFDIVIMLEVIEHLNRSADTLKEVSRVIKRGGTLVISTPNNASILWRTVEYLYLYLFKFDISRVHINMYTRDRLENQLKRFFNFVNVKTMSYGMGLFAVCKK